MGGVLEVLTVMFSLVASKYARVRLQALIANRLYYLNSTIREEMFQNNSLSEQELIEKGLMRNATGQIQLNVPLFLPA